MSLSTVTQQLNYVGVQCRGYASQFPTAHPHICKVAHYGLCLATAVYFSQSLIGRAALFGTMHAALCFSKKAIPIFSSIINQAPNTTIDQGKKELILTKTELDDNNFKNHLLSNPSLSSLSIHECTLNDQTVELIADLIKKNRLTYLGLAYISFSDRQIQLLAEALAQNGSLQECHLSYCIPDDESLKLITQSLAGHCHIHTLCLESNAVGQDGILAMAQFIRTNQVVEKLKLAYQLFQDPGSEHLAHALQKNNCLKSLDLSNNAMTQESYNLFLKESQDHPLLNISLPSKPSSFQFL